MHKLRQDDSQLILQGVAGFFVQLPCPNNADVDGDGFWGPVDAQLILQYDAGLLDSLPA